MSRRSPRAAGISLLVSCLVGAAIATASERRNIRFDRISLEDGLSQSAINTILQDERGVMWFGTEDGLNRYDGYRFRVFKHEPQNPSSLASGFIESLLLDGENRLWVGTNGGGLHLMDRKAGTFERFQSDPDRDDSLGHDIVLALAEAADGKIWVGTDGGGLNRLDPRTGRFERWTHDAESALGLPSNRIRALHVGNRGMLWIATNDEGLARFDPSVGEFKHYRHDPNDERSLSDDAIHSLYADVDGSLWIGTFGAGLNHFDPATGIFTRFSHDPEDPFSLGPGRVRSATRDLQGTLWVGTDDGLAEWSADARRFYHYRHRAHDPSSPSDDMITSLYQERGGVLWVGTKSGGLNKWHVAKSTFRHIGTDPDAEIRISHGVVTSFAEDSRGRIWVGTFGGGLNLLDLKRRTTRVIGKPDGLPDERVMSLAADGEQLWIGTYASGLVRYDPELETFEVWRHDPEDPRSLGSNGVMTILRTEAGDLWVGTYEGGLHRLDRARGDFERFVHDPSSPSSLQSNVVTRVVEAANGDLLIGTDGGGLHVYRPDARGFEVHRANHSRTDSLSSDDIWSIHEDPQGRVWLGTEGGGLNVWETADRRVGRSRFRVYTEVDGLPNNNIYGILQDHRNMLWLSTNRGLSRFDDVRGEFRNFDVTHGLQSNEFNFGAYYHASDRQLYFGGVKGLNVFRADEPRGNSHRPPVLLTGFFKLNERVPIDLSENGSITLDHRDSVVSFEFAALDYSSPERNQYAYRLEGFDRDWNEVGTNRRATYTNLDAGRYTLRVRASNNDGVWNEEAFALDLVVLPPPWKTWWAFLLYGLAGAAGVVAFVRAQTRKLREEEQYNRRLQEEVAHRTAELRDRNHELKGLNDRLENASYTDPMTGLRNRRFLMTKVAPTLERRDPGEDESWAFLMIDLDGLKKTNDTYGHEAGDEVILQACANLRKTCRATDTIVRLGGDEFLVIGRGIGMAQAEVMAERIRTGIASHRFVVGPGIEAKITCSVGIAHYPFYRDDRERVAWEQVVTLADRALYLAKEQGRDGWISIESGRDGRERVSPDSLIDRDLLDLIRSGLVQCRASFRSEEWAPHGTA